LIKTEWWLVVEWWLRKTEWWLVVEWW